ncbi:MAG: MmcQ/YjbR family DNA-binding protein [Sporomusaceae bacterium]|nr:MmcQ/YjbR family DNA-binding protein [Sporomusaceae bacterium]
MKAKSDADFLRQMFEDVTPAYHMNKTHWNTVTLGGDVPEDEIKGMIERSYDLIKPKARNKGVRLSIKNIGTVLLEDKLSVAQRLTFWRLTKAPKCPKLQRPDHRIQLPPTHIRDSARRCTLVSYSRITN